MFGSLSLIKLFRIIVFSLFLVSLLSLICHKTEKRRIIYLIVLIILCFYSLLELQFTNFIGRFYSFNAVGEGLKGVTVFIPVFFRTIKPIYSLIILPLVLFVCINFIEINKQSKTKISSKLIMLVLSISLFVVSLVKEDEEYKTAIKNHDSYEIVIEKMGINSFLFTDLFSSFLPKAEVNEEFVIEEIRDDVKEEIVELDLHRRFDDSNLIETMDNETNEKHKQIDEYILSRNIDSKNDKTGIYEGYNFVYFMVESFDYIAIDKELTPTLYKMYEKGYSFLNHYTPIYVCGTGDSEWVGMTGTFPSMNECIAYNKVVDSHQSLAGLFKNAGYDCLSFHNWDDQFYPRTIYQLNYGFDDYYDQNDLKLKLVNGWLSDSELVEKALPYFINSDHFFSFIITSTMHFPYDVNSYYGDLNLDRVNEVHPDYPLNIKRYLSKSMEFDKSLELLESELEKAGKLDNTVIAIYGDHHPKTIDGDVLIECCETIDKSGPYGLDKLPFIIYNAASNGEFNYEYCCNLDQLPTIANMFNLNYDSRLYCGRDIYTGESAAIFPNGDFMTSKGMYHFKAKTFDDFGDYKASENYYLNKNAEIQNMRNINQLMIKTNYYKDYQFVIDPKNVENNE